MGIRYFVDYCKSNEIILEEKKKLAERQREEVFRLLLGIFIQSYILGEGLRILGEMQCDTQTNK